MFVSDCTFFCTPAIFFLQLRPGLNSLSSSWKPWGSPTARFWRVACLHRSLDFYCWQTSCESWEELVDTIDVWKRAYERVCIARDEMEASTLFCVPLKQSMLVTHDSQIRMFWLRRSIKVSLSQRTNNSGLASYCCSLQMLVIQCWSTVIVSEAISETCLPHCLFERKGKWP